MEMHPIPVRADDARGIRNFEGLGLQPLCRAGSHRGQPRSENGDSRPPHSGFTRLLAARETASLVRDFYLGRNYDWACTL
jgi:hypothetical protein